ncbi:MAG TPA: PEGA domain-containing protein [Polyangiaceae bacterium]|nr:PEGA domain-containing protein [Polyangiaceae bacterium]
MNPASCAKALVVASALGTPEAAFAELHGIGPASGIRASEPLPAAASGSRYEARQRFDRGLAAYNAGDFMGALAELQRAHAIVAHPLVLYNIALVQARLGHVVESLEALEHLERSGLASLAPERQQRARELRATLSERVGSIRIETDVENALIQVDGVDVGRTPSPPIRVAAGVHLVSVSAQGYEPRRFRTLVAGKATEVIELALVPLQQPLSRLEVITNVPDVQVRANGELLGQTPLETPFSLKPGEYALELVRDGYAPWQRRVSLQPGQAQRVALVMEPLGPDRSRGGRLSLTVSEPDAVVVVDGRPQAHLARGIFLPAGRHTVRVQRAGFFDVERSISIRTGLNPIDVRLVPTADYLADYTSRARAFRTWGYVSLAAGGILAAGSGVFLSWNQREIDEAERAFARHEAEVRASPSGACKADTCEEIAKILVEDLDAKRKRQALGWVGVGVGAAGIATGVLLFALGPDPDRYEPGSESDIFANVSFTFGADRVGLSFRY